MALISARGGATILRRHWALVTVLGAGAALRALAMVAIYPGIWFPDANDYVHEAATGTLSVVRVGGYALVVAPFWRLGSAAALIVLQHCLGLAIVVLLYALLVRRGARRWLAALAVAPAALDAYLVDIEHMIMSETVFHLVLVGAVAVLLWPERPGRFAALAGGLLLGYAGVVRSVALPFVALLVTYLLVRRVGWRRVAAFCAAWAVVVGAYATLFRLQHGTFAFTEYGSRFLYAQVAPFADCRRIASLAADERALCPNPRLRLNRTAYLWGARTPIHGLPRWLNARIADFSLRVILAQPLDYVGLVGGSLLHYLEPGHHISFNDYPIVKWQFPSAALTWGPHKYSGPIRPNRYPRHWGTTPGPYIDRMVGQPRIDPAVSRLLHEYQRYGYAGGQVLAPCLLFALFAIMRRRGPWRLRLDAALLAACALAALFMAAALSVFDYRYALSGDLLLPAAAALAGTAWRSTAAPASAAAGGSRTTAIRP